ncbi:MAG TPA: glycosyltransferase 87 family protein [Actinomadura sp.]|nr:glycosyltransferase 87 family protein [Actinomadura sp.]
MSQSSSDVDGLVGSGGATGNGGPGPHGVNIGDASPRPARLVPVLTGAAVLVCVLGYLQKLPCRSAGFDFVKTVTRACYTDVYPLYFNRGLSDGKIPYLDTIEEPVEYPVLTGWFMHVVNMVVRSFVPPGGTGRGMAFYDLTALVLGVLAVVAVLATAYAAGDRGGMKAGLMVALSPGLLLAAYINWDLLAVGLCALAVAAWSRRRHTVAGVLLGLAIAAKFYPVVLLWPFVLLCLRAGRRRELVHLLAGTAGAWLAVDLPVMIMAPDGWSRFYSFSKERGIDWGSVFFFLMDHGVPAASDVDRLNLMGQGAFAVLCLAIGVLALAAPRRPRLPQLLVLVLAAFMLTNKVWSPQYVLWLLPLVALARPRLPAYLVWQAGEIVYFLAIWWYLLAVTRHVQGADLATTLSALAHGGVPDEGIGVNVYYLGLFARFLAVLLLAALITRDILRPEHDLVRLDGRDDPAGGVLDTAPDRLSLRTLRGRTGNREPALSARGR